MNCLIREQMFTYFYNKFRPVNRMHYIKCGVNSSLVTQFWLLQKVCGTFDLCFIKTHSIQKEGDLQIYFGVIFCETRYHAQAHVTSGGLIHCVLSLAARRTQMAAQLGWRYAGQCLLWEHSSLKTFLRQHLVFQPVWGCGNLCPFQLPQSNSSLDGAWISVGVFTPKWR